MLAMTQSAAMVYETVLFPSLLIDYTAFRHILQMTNYLFGLLD
jgi:hypothetical protein